MKSERSSLPVVACCAPPIDPQRIEYLAEMAGRLMRDEPAFASSRHFGMTVHQEVNDRPALIFGDQREINLYLQTPSTRLDYRMAVLAQPGDIVMVSHRDEAFERYLANYLQLDGIRFTAVEQEKNGTLPVSVRCRTEAELCHLIGDLAVAGDGLLILPYLTTGNVWRLAQRIGEDTGMPIGICGPSPRISTHVNNKIWFANHVRRLIGADAVPPSYVAYGPAAAAAHIARLRKTSERVVVKIPDSAGSYGNISFASGEIAGLSLFQLRQMLLSLLHGRGWRDTYPVLVGVWECDVLSSPSVQLWIPGEQDGLPIVEGIFEQIVRNNEGKFVGARPADLSPSIKVRLVEEAFLITTLLQKLGYFGRCSLDAIVSGVRQGTAVLHWIECNGRWGGVSIPMTLANRLDLGGTMPGRVIVQQSQLHSSVYSTEQALQKLEDILFDLEAPGPGIILLSPPDGINSVWINFMAVGTNQEMAENLADEAVTRFQS
ncbi:MAG: hypothetical protein K9G33_14215 [Sneathiella sp.]|nr:hypothetical protein [Sneathiella sp.]